MNNAACRLIIILGVLLFSCAYTYAAEIYHINASCYFSNKKCNEQEAYAIIIKGEIVQGDAEKFKKVLAGSVAPPWIYIRSPGGSVYDAIEIGRVIRKLLLSVDAPEIVSDDASPVCYENDYLQNRNECLCASACFLIYAAGVPRNNASILLHRTFITPSKNANMVIDKSIRAAENTRKEVTSYLQEMGIPNEYIDLMFMTPSNSVKPISYLKMRDELSGYPQEIQEWLMSKCGNMTYNQWLIETDRIEGLRVGGSKKYEEESERFFSKYKENTDCEGNALDEGKKYKEFVKWRLNYYLNNQ